MANPVHSQHQKANSPKEPQEATPLGCVRAVGWGLFGNSQNSYQMIEANQKHLQIWTILGINAWKGIYSYKKVLLLLTTSPYKMSLHTEFFCCFWCSITASWAYKKPQKDKLYGLIKWLGTSKLLQNEHLKIHNFAFWVPCYKKAWLGVFL